MFGSEKGVFGGYVSYGPQAAGAGAAITHSTSGSVGTPAAVLAADANEHAVWFSFGGSCYVTFGGETGGSAAGGGIAYGTGDQAILPVSLATSAKFYFASSGSSYAAPLKPAS